MSGAGNVRGTLRDWSWAWGGKSWGPVVLGVLVAKSADEIRRFHGAQLGWRDRDC